MKKLLIIFFVIIFAQSACFAAMEYDLKGGLFGSGGYGIGGSVVSPINANLEYKVSLYLAQFGGLSGISFPLTIDFDYSQAIYNIPLYVGGGINYPLGSAKKGNSDVSFGLGFQAHGGVIYPISDNMSALGELGAMLINSKVAGGSMSMSTIFCITGGLRFSPNGRTGTKIETASGIVAEEKWGTVNIKGIPDNLVAALKTKTNTPIISPDKLSKGEIISILFTAGTDKRIETVSAVFNSDNKVYLKENNNIWSAGFKIPDGFISGNKSLKVFVKEAGKKPAMFKLNYAIN